MNKNSHIVLISCELHLYRYENKLPSMYVYICICTQTYGEIWRTGKLYMEDGEKISE